MKSGETFARAIISLHRGIFVFLWIRVLHSRYYPDNRPLTAYSNEFINSLDDTRSVIRPS